MTRKRAIDFDRVWQGGTKRVGQYTVVYYAYIEYLKDNSKISEPSMGCIVTKKTRTAVVRNKIKRWYRQIFRSMSGSLPVNVSMIWIARSTAETAGYHRIKDEIKNILGKEGFDCDGAKSV